MKKTRKEIEEKELKEVKREINWNETHLQYFSHTEYVLNLILYMYD